MVYDPYSAAISAGASALEAGVGYINTVKTNEANMEIANATNEANKEIAAAANALQQDMFNAQMDYNRAVQEESWNRADTTFQRAVMDATNAGLSPLAVLENANNNGGIISAPGAPSMHVPTMIGAQMSPLNPAFFGSLEDGARAMLEIISQDKRLSAEKKLTVYKEEQENYRFERQLRATSALTNKQLNLQNSRESRELQESIREFNATLENTVTEQNRRYALEEADKLSQYVTRMTGGASGAYKKYDNYDEYNTALRDWADAYSEKTQDIVANFSKSKNASGSGGLHVNVGPVGVGAQGSGSSGESTSKNFDTYYKHEMASWVAKNPRPVYIGK